MMALQSVWSPACAYTLGSFFRWRWWRARASAAVVSLLASVACAPSVDDAAGSSSASGAAGAATSAPSEHAGGRAGTAEAEAHVGGSPSSGTAGAESNAGAPTLEAAGAAATGTDGTSTAVESTRLLEARFHNSSSQFTILGDLDMGFVSGVGSCDRALSLYAHDEPPSPWDYQISRTIPKPVKKDDVIYLQFWARSPDLRSVEVVWELSQSPYTKMYARVWPLGAGWTLYQMRMTALEDYAGNTTALRFRMGYGMGVYEIACVTLDNYGPNPDLSQLPETNLTWGGYVWDRNVFRSETDKRIRTHRMGSYTVTVRDAAGDPVAGASVHVQQTRHKFVFGTAVRSSVYVSNGMYASTVPEYFNQVTIENDLKWREWESATTRTQGLQAIALAKAQGLGVKGHNLVWTSNYPERLDPLDSADVLEEVRAHIEDELVTLGSDVLDWDVVNEPYFAPELYDRVGNDRQLLRDAFTWARRYAPAGTDLFVNEYTLHESGNPAVDVADPAYDLVEWMVDSGIDFDGIGLEGHMVEPYPTPLWLWHRLDRFGALGKRVQVTELDVLHQDDDVQADVLDVLVRTFFAHPAVDGITLWGFWAGAHWKGSDAALFEMDFTPKPSGDLFIDLVRGQWWTDESCETDSTGQCTLEVFLGEHSVSVTGGSASAKADVSIGEAGATVPVALVLVPRVL